MSCLDRLAIFSLAKAKIPALSGAKGGGSSTPDKGKSAPRKPTVIDYSSLKEGVAPTANPYSSAHTFPLGYHYWRPQ
jgi:hypothetical protein